MEILKLIWQDEYIGNTLILIVRRGLVEAKFNRRKNYLVQVRTNNAILDGFRKFDDYASLLIAWQCFFKQPSAFEVEYGYYPEVGLGFSR